MNTRKRIRTLLGLWQGLSVGLFWKAIPSQWRHHLRNVKAIHKPIPKHKASTMTSLSAPLWIISDPLLFLEWAESSGIFPERELVVVRSLVLSEYLCK